MPTIINQTEFIKIWAVYHREDLFAVHEYLNDLLISELNHGLPNLLKLYFKTFFYEVQHHDYLCHDCMMYVVIAKHLTFVGYYFAKTIQVPYFVPSCFLAMFHLIFALFYLVNLGSRHVW